MWKGKPLASIWRGTDENQVTLHLGRTATILDLAKKQVTDDQGTVYRYGKLLLATGGTPRRLPFGGDDILYYRYLSGYFHLRQQAEEHQLFAVIGAEIAAALAMNGKQVTMIFTDGAIGERIYLSDLTAFVTDYYREKGVQVVAGEEVVGLDKFDNRLQVQTKSGKSITASTVVAGIGITPT